MGGLVGAGVNGWGWLQPVGPSHCGKQAVLYPQWEPVGSVSLANTSRTYNARRSQER